MAINPATSTDDAILHAKILYDIRTRFDMRVREAKDRDTRREPIVAMRAMLDYIDRRLAGTPASIGAAMFIPSQFIEPFGSE